MNNLELKELKDTFKKINVSTYRRYSKSIDLSKDECFLLTFTELLENNDLLKYIIPAKSRRKYKQGYSSILGYSRIGITIEDDDSEDVEEPEDETEEVVEPKKEYTYTLFNGIFVEDDLSTIPISDVRKLIRETRNFIVGSLTNNLIEDYTDARKFQEIFHNDYIENRIERINICILTNQNIHSIEKEPKEISIKELNLVCNSDYWDLRRYNSIIRGKLPRVPIEINLDNEFLKYKSKINFTFSQSDKFKNYIAIFPCDLIADLYERHHTQLLERNIRVFLQLRRKANKNMKDTLTECPKHFFAFNNGIVAIASNVLVDKEGKIRSIQNFQVVNGGQTTAALYHVRRSGISLTKAQVQVKLISFNCRSIDSELVNRISQAANTQTRVKSSDFFANHPYLVEVEKHSKKIVFISQDKSPTYYFFERMSGQYKVTENIFLEGRRKKEWKSEHPEKLKFDKVDLARWANCRNLAPFTAASSAEKQFVHFMNSVDGSNITKINQNDYKSLVGFGLLFKRARLLCGFSKRKAYPSIIGDSSVGMATTIYSMSYFHYISECKFDYHLIYDGKLNIIESLKQVQFRVNSAIDQELEEIIRNVWYKIKDFGSTSVQENTKKKECWDYVKAHVRLEDKTIKKINRWKLSQDIIDERKKQEENNVEIYFDSLSKLLDNNFKFLKSLNELTKTDIDYKKHRIVVDNFIRKIKAKSPTLSESMVKKIMKIVSHALSNGIDLNDYPINGASLDESWIKFVNVDFKYLYINVFKCSDEFKAKVDDKIYNAIDHMDKNKNQIDDLEEAKQIVDEYKIKPGLSLEQIERLNIIYDHWIK